MTPHWKSRGNPLGIQGIAQQPMQHPSLLALGILGHPRRMLREGFDPFHEQIGGTFEVLVQCPQDSKHDGQVNLKD
jgi:hypothetical protein